jgi:hypothetical protein
MTQKNTHILSLGLGQSNFLNQLYGALKKEDASLRFSIDRVYDISEGKRQPKNELFEQEYDFSGEEYAPSTRFVSTLKILFQLFFWRSLFFELKHKRSFTTVKRHYLTRMIYQSAVDKKILPLNHDIYHFHYCTPYNLRYLFHLPRSAKVICSFWGSDLYRNRDERTLFYVKNALERANVISIQTPEMGEALLKRYGEKLRPKLRFALFAQEVAIYDKIDVLQKSPDRLAAFKTKLGIPQTNTVIAVGYSATSAFHHIEVLKTIQKLPPDVLENLTVVLSLTYQREANYLRELQAFCDTVRSFQIVQLHNFLNFEEVAALRVITDIQIQMPVSDALSGSVTEVLYAENVVIAGDWLPYAIFERRKISFYKVSGYLELEKLLPRIVKDLRLVKLKNVGNKAGIRAYFFPETTSRAWLKIYRDII